MTRENGSSNGQNKTREKVFFREERLQEIDVREEGLVERMDCEHTPHIWEWLVVCGLGWMDGWMERGRKGVMKDRSVLNFARNCVKGPCASLQLSGERKISMIFGLIS